MRKSSKRRAAGALAALMILLWTSPGHAMVEAQAPQVQARGAVLMEATTGRILWQQNARAAMPMASVTKVMTAILAIEGADLSAVVTVDPRACGVGGTSISLKPGEQLTVEQLLYGLMLPSGNDAAMALALYLAGSVEAFAELMNQKAGLLGCVNTRFANPHGLPAEGHYTTAADMARICSYAIQNPVFARIVSTESIVIPGDPWNRHLFNKNRLLWQYEGCNGIKTGFTRAAGRCLAASAQRDGMQLVAVVLNCPDMFEACARLLDYGFAHYGMKKVRHRGSLLGTAAVTRGLTREVPLVAGADVVLPLRKDGDEEPSITLSAPDTVEAPVWAGERAGTAWVTLNDMLVEVPLLYGQSVERDTLLNRLRQTWKRWYNKVISRESEDALCGCSGTSPSAG